MHRQEISREEEGVLSLLRIWTKTGGMVLTCQTASSGSGTL